MKIRQLLVLAAVPLVVGSLGFTVASNAATRQVSQVAQNSTQPNQQRPGPHRHPRIDFAAAAQKLGITEAQLKEALGVPANPPAAGDRSQRPRLDIKGAASKLGVTEQQLVEALGLPPRPNLAAAAQKLGVTEAQLKEALGVPANPPSPGSDRTQRPPRPDLKSAAAKLGVTEQQLIDALGIPPRPPGDRPANPPTN